MIHNVCFLRSLFVVSYLVVTIVFPIPWKPTNLLCQGKEVPLVEEDKVVEVEVQVQNQRFDRSVNGYYEYHEQEKEYYHDNLVTTTSTEGHSFITPCQCENDKEYEKIIKKYKFCNIDLSINERVQSLINELTVDEKLGLFLNDASTIQRLNISRYQWWNEALHGVAMSPGVHYNADAIAYTTVFPQVIVSASSFNTTLFQQLGVAISSEARSMYNYKNGKYAGLTYWTPNVNLFRDPRWGRGQETPGEDPYLTSVYAQYYIPGLQGEYDEEELEQDNNTPSNYNVNNHDERYLKISACCKHYYGYDIENITSYGSSHYTRFNLNTHITQQDLIESYLKPFEACIKKAKASSIMCSYNANNGIPSCSDRDMLTKKLRTSGKNNKSWNFDGYITGDCGAVQAVQEQHVFTASMGQTIRSIFRSGTDIDCGNYLTRENLQNAIANNYISEEKDMNTHLFNLFRVQFRLGLYNPIYKQPYRDANKYNANTTIRCEKHTELSKDAARQGMVLLKNNKNTLPLIKIPPPLITIHNDNTTKYTTNKILIIGPLANDAKAPLGNYYGRSPKVYTPLDGIVQYVNETDNKYEVSYIKGLDSISDNNITKYINDCIVATQSHNIILFVIGIDQSIEKESHDRVDLNLPGKQKELVQSISKMSKKYNPNSKIIIGLVSGGSVDIHFAKTSDDIDSILWLGYAGEYTGLVMNELLFGITNPSGKLTQTFYKNEYTNQISMTDMSYRPNNVLKTPGRGYRFYNRDPIYKFGYGLSYTTFDYQLETIDILSSSKGGIILYNNNNNHKNRIGASSSSSPSSIDNTIIRVCSNFLPASSSSDSGILLDSDEDYEFLESYAFSISVRVMNPSNQLYGGQNVILAFLEPLTEVKNNDDKKNNNNMDTNNNNNDEDNEVVTLPKKTLIGFARTKYLKPNNEETIITINIQHRHLYHVNTNGKYELSIPQRSMINIADNNIRILIENVEECTSSQRGMCLFFGLFSY